MTQEIEHIIILPTDMTNQILTNLCVENCLMWTVTGQNVNYDYVSPTTGQHVILEVFWLLKAN